MGLGLSPRLPSTYVPPAGGTPTLLGDDPNLVPVADPPPNAGTATARKAVIRYLPGVGQTYLDSEFASKIDAFRRHARDQGVELQFVDAYRMPEHQKFLIDHQQTRNDIAFSPAERSYHSAGLAVDVAYKNQDPATQQVILDATRKAGLNWGGDYKDYNHFDFRPPCGIDSLINNFTNQISIKDAPP